jgi:dTDP-glucose 4,6-dehydratase
VQDSRTEGKWGTMNYLVTGGAGFIGSTYVHMLLTNQLGPVDSVKVIDKLTYAGSLENLKSISSDVRFTFIKGDICDEELVNSCIMAGDTIVHFAAESHVDRSISGPSDFIRTNIVGTHVLLSAAMRKKAGIFLHVSTDEVYGSVKTGSSKESDSLNPNSPYSASKASSDLLVRAYVQTFGLDARITRCCNNYGINQFPEKFIPLVIEKIKNQKKIPIYGDGSNVREWIHVKDHCLGIQLAITKGKKGEIYNIGSTECFSNLELVKIILSRTNSSLNMIEFVTDRKGHDFRYSLNSKKSEVELGFTHSYSLIKGIDELLMTAGLL